ncbi:MAG: LuxR family transcription regulator [Thermoleophilia bacterium]|nr:LuxR family transcription regulator [Thermoleophilia bacterium]
MVSDPQPVARLGICDDVPAFRRLLSLVFQMENDIEVVGEAGNGLEAIDLVSSRVVDVLLIDMSMPIMDGLEALPKILDASPSTKVVMLTGFGTDAIRRRAMDAGAARYLEKGLLPDEILRAIREVHAS